MVVYHCIHVHIWYTKLRLRTFQWPPFGTALRVLAAFEDDALAVGFQQGLQVVDHLEEFLPLSVSPIMTRFGSSSTCVDSESMSTLFINAW